MLPWASFRDLPIAKQANKFATYVITFGQQIRRDGPGADSLVSQCNTFGILLVVRETVSSAEPLSLRQARAA